MRRVGRFLLRFALVVVVLVLIFVGCSAVWTWQDDRRADMTTEGPYQATVESLNNHPLPQWFADAKFGIMIHWGLYSVPGFAPKGTTFSKLLETQYGHAMTHNPYAEDYANAMKDPASPTAQYHREHYGNAPYSDFTQQFDAGLAKWDPDRWATQFKAAGASYIVVTAKYADGYSLWPTQVRNPHAPDFHAQRDLMGELAAAVRKQGLKFGVYYSGGVDWTFQRKTVKTLGDYVYLHYGEDYRKYAVAQVRELITRYKPDILWNDIAWPTGSKRLYALLADYYNTVPEGVVDDRWSTASFGRQLISPKPMRWGFDQLMKGLFKQPGVADGINTQKPAPHSDFRTPEYADFDTIQRRGGRDRPGAVESAHRHRGVAEGQPGGPGRDATVDTVIDVHSRRRAGRVHPEGQGRVRRRPRPATGRHRHQGRRTLRDGETSRGRSGGDDDIHRGHRAEGGRRRDLRAGLQDRVISTSRCSGSGSTPCTASRTWPRCSPGPT